LVMALTLTTVLTGSWVPLGVVVSSLLLALLLSRGFLVEQLRGQIRHLEWYIKRQAPFIYKQARVRPLLKAIRNGAWVVAAEEAYTGRRGVDDFSEVLNVIGREPRPIVLSLDTSEAYAFLSQPCVRVCTYNGQESLRGDLEGFLDLLLWRYPWVHGIHLPAIV